MHTPQPEQFMHQLAVAPQAGVDWNQPTPWSQRPETQDASCCFSLSPSQL